MADPTIKLEVWRNASGIVTVTTDDFDGGGSRLCGVKLVGSGSRLVAEFRLNRTAVDALSEELAQIEARAERAGGSQ